MKKQLTFKQQRFVEEFLVDGNAKQAAIRAGYSEKTAEQQGYQLLQNTLVLAAIEAGHKILRERCAVSVETLTDELEAARLHAMADEKGASAAVSAIMGKAKLHGLIVDKKELSGGLTMTHEEALDQLDGDEPVPVQQWRQ
jgi:phage terminase small subunit